MVSIWGRRFCDRLGEPRAAVRFSVASADRPPPVGLRVLVCLSSDLPADFLSVTGLAETFLQSDHSINWEIAAQGDASCVFETGPLPRPCTEWRWPVAGLLGPSTHQPGLWQGPRSMSCPPPRRQAWLLEKPQIFNFSPRLALPRRKTPELQKHGTNVSPWALEPSG